MMLLDHHGHILNTHQYLFLQQQKKKEIKHFNILLFVTQSY